MTADPATWRSRAPDGPADVGIAVGLAALTWLVALLGVGVLARLQPTSLLSLLSLVAVGLLAWPVVRIAPWRPGGPTRVRRWARRHRGELAGTGFLLLAVASPVQPAALDPVLSLLRMPFRAAAGFLYGPSLVYERALTPAFGRALFRVAQWYLAAVVLYVVASLVVQVGRSVRGRAEA